MDLLSGGAVSGGVGWGEGEGGRHTSERRIASLGRAAAARDGRAERERRSDSRIEVGVASRRIVAEVAPGR